jgi:predicted DNA-binding WGR domain protein
VPHLAPAGVLGLSKAKPLERRQKTMHTRLEFKDGSSNKFWEGQVDGSVLVTRWGKLGTEGQTKSFAFSSPDEAEKALHDKAREKTKKGYVGVNSSASPPEAGSSGATSARKASDAPPEETAETTLLSAKVLRAFTKENPGKQVRLLLTREDADLDLSELASQEEALASVDELIAKGATLTHEGEPSSGAKVCAACASSRSRPAR